MMDDYSSMLIPDEPRDADVERRGGASICQLQMAVAAMARVIELGLKSEAEEARKHLRVARALLNMNERTALTCAKVAQDLLRPGLAPWQARLLKTHVESNLSDAIRCTDLARLAHLSVSRFSRAFRNSFGCSPHVYIVRARLQRARILMSSTGATLGDIALECGFADQPHFSRQFRRIMQITPGVWRRANRGAPDTN